jgi:predicted dehydrogenase
MMYSFHWRAGIPSDNGQTGLIWIIDGDAGCVRLEGRSSNLHIEGNVPTIWVNGEKVTIEPDNEGLTIIGRAWKAFAQDDGYANIDDALRVQSMLDGIAQSAKQGKRIEF